MTYLALRAAVSLALFLPSWASANDFDVDCVVMPHKETRISAEVSGILSRISVRLGQDVKKGDELARLNTRLLEARIASSRVDLGFNTREMERAMTAGEGVSKTELDEIQTNVARAQSELNQLKAEFEQLIMRAPHDGVITEILLNEGEQVSESHVLELTKVYPLKIDLNVAAEARELFDYDRDIWLSQGDSEMVSTTPTFIEPTIDLASQSFKVNAELNREQASDWVAGARCSHIPEPYAPINQ